MCFERMDIERELEMLLRFEKDTFLLFSFRKFYVKDLNKHLDFVQ